MMSSTTLHLQRPSSPRRKARGWQSWLSSGRALLLAVSVVMVLDVRTVAAAQAVQCPEGQVAIELAGDIPDVVFEESSVLGDKHSKR